jgi:hypothetical protein
MSTSCGDSFFDSPDEIPFLAPDSGTAWTTYGNYGSGQFDPMDPAKKLHIVICDNCLHKNKDRVRYVEEEKRKTIKEQSKWDPKTH